MLKATTKLFREPEQAEKAIAELKSRGYGTGEIGILISEKGDKERFAPDLTPVANVSLPGVSPIIAKGAVASAISESSAPMATLIEIWGISEETLNYYQFALPLGGIVLSVHAEEDRLEQAKQLLREMAKATAGLERHPMWSTCPPFDIASRMSETNPIDAPMTGDFRRY